MNTFSEEENSDLEIDSFPLLQSRTIAAVASDFSAADNIDNNC